MASAHWHQRRGGGRKHKGRGGETAYATCCREGEPAHSAAEEAKG